MIDKEAANKISQLPTALLSMSIFPKKKENLSSKAFCHGIIEMPYQHLRKKG
jgi:hypothetical protein